MIKRLSFAQRLQSAFALAVVFLLIFATNRLDARHFEAVQDTINTVYDDRIVAQDHIYHLSRLYHRKSLLLAGGKGAGGLNENKEIAELFAKFERTKLTVDEQAHFEQLKNHHKDLRELEDSEPSEERDAALRGVLSQVEEDLNHLAAVQVKESRRRTLITQKLLNASSLISRIEIGFLVVLGLLLQVLILVKPWE